MNSYESFKNWSKKNYRGPLSASDILIRYQDGSKDGLVLISRKNTPYGLALPGGMAESLTLFENARKEAYEETGLTVILDEPNRPFRVMASPGDDPRAHIASHVYTARGYGHIQPDPKEDALSAKNYSRKELENVLQLPVYNPHTDDKNSPVWAFRHHQKIVSAYLAEWDIYTKKKIATAAAIGRFKPLHWGGAVMLEALCQEAEVVRIGLGSSNKYNLRNPFTARESREMIEAFLAPRFSNYEFIEVPDFAHLSKYTDGQKWREFVVKNLGEPTVFASGNPWVSQLLQGDYQIIHPSFFVHPDKRIKLRATEVRYRMARGDHWESLLPPEVVKYLQEKGLVQRFQREFAAATLNSLKENLDFKRSETAEEELNHAREK